MLIISKILSMHIARFIDLLYNKLFSPGFAKLFISTQV